MRIVTNPGSNIDEALSLARDIDITPQRIVVDGIPHDTRNTIDFEKVDSWVRRATVHPHVLGTTTADYVEYFTQIGRKDPEILAIMTSRKIIGSHDAALEAVAQLAKSEDPARRALRVEVVDSGGTDVGPGLLTILATEARTAGWSLVATAELLRKMAARLKVLFIPATLDNLIKGGRASFLTGWVANFFEIRPLIAFVEGELKSVGRMKASADLGAKAAEFLADRVDVATGPFWLGVSHGNDERRGQRVVDALRERYQPSFVYFRPISTSIYLHVGPGAVVVALLPLSGVPFPLNPPKP